MSDPLQDALEMFARFESTAEPELLDHGIRILDHGAAGLPGANSELPTYLLALGKAYRTRYLRSRDPGDLDRSLTALSVAHGKQRMLNGDTFEFLDELCSTRSALYVETGQREQVEAAILGRKSLRTQVRGDPDRRVRMLHNLGTDYRHRFDGEGDTEDLERSVLCLHHALQICPEDHESRGRVLISLADAIHRRYEVAENVDDLRAAVHFRSDALRHAPAASAETVDQWLTLAEELSALYVVSNDPSVLEQAIGILDEAARSASLNPAIGPRVHSNIAALILLRYAHTSDVADLDDAVTELDRAIEVLDAAAETVATAAADRQGFERALGTVLRQRYARTHNAADLRRAATLDAGERPSSRRNRR